MQYSSPSKFNVERAPSKTQKLAEQCLAEAFLLGSTGARSTGGGRLGDNYIKHLMYVCRTNMIDMSILHMMCLSVRSVRNA